MAGGGGEGAIHAGHIVSDPDRATRLSRLASESFDLLVVGGGIIGAGIARDAALRGLKVALIEQGDFAGGTSSKTSKLIHGGLRYLEHGHLPLVIESLRERAVLRAIAPTLVEPLPLLLPVYRGDPRAAWKIGLGLRLYALLAWRDQMRSNRMVTAAEALALEPYLRQNELQGAGLYTDCQMDDARLCLANILQSVESGAVCCNYVRLRMFMTADARVFGGIGEDRLTGRACEIRATVVVNATGPWADGVRRMSDPKAGARLAPTKGIHLILPRIVRHGLFVQARSDGRMLFIVPRGGGTMVGTTESPLESPPETLRADRDEVAYLLEEVNGVLPGVHLSERDVVATFAGARPLLAFSGAAQAASREHRIEEDARGVISILGGKFTTYRRMASQVVDVVLRRSRKASTRAQTHQVSLLEAMDPVVQNAWEPLARTIDAALLGRLLARYGAKATHILTLIEEDRSLGLPACPHHPYLRAELAHAIRHELACTITDVLARRTPMAWSPCQGLDCLPTLIELFIRYGASSQSHIQQYVEEYRRFLADGLSFRKSKAGSDP